MPAATLKGRAGDAYAAGPCGAAFDVTPSDEDDLPAVAVALWIGTAGDLTVIPIRAADGVTGQENGPTARLFKNVPVGWWDAISVKQVLATGTTAADIVGIL